MASRSLDTLRPEVAEKARAWLAACAARGVDVLVYCTLRSAVEQAALYTRGRSMPGPIVTNAPAWTSFHQYGRAWDCVPMVNGKPDWSYSDVNCDRIPDEPWWAVMVEEADLRGIEWAGRWKTFKEFVHFQVTGGLSVAQAYAQIHEGESIPGVHVA